MDKVFIEGLEIEALIGIYDWERRIRQPLRFDIEMAFDNRVPAASDRIADTLDYKAVSKRLIAFVSQSGFGLVETLAERCAALILDEFAVSKVRLKLSKPGAVRGAQAVGVIIKRKRGDERIDAAERGNAQPAGAASSTRSSAVATTHAPAAQASQALPVAAATPAPMPPGATALPWTATTSIVPTAGASTATAPAASAPPAHTPPAATPRLPAITTAPPQPASAPTHARAAGIDMPRTPVSTNQAPAPAQPRTVEMQPSSSRFQSTTRQAYLSLGSNIAPEINLPRAVAALRARFGHVVVSPVYRTRAVGFSGPDFLNAIAVINSDIHPFALNDWLHALELRQGRDRRDASYSDRTLDIDIIYFGDLVLDGPGDFQLPRPELHHAFVLKPLADVAPGFVDPVRRMTLEKLWAAHPEHDRPPQQVALEL